VLPEAGAQESPLPNGACADYSGRNQVSARDTELQSFVQWSLPLCSCAKRNRIYAVESAGEQCGM
jgi:hypothetical protein